MDLYAENILDHYKHPRHAGSLTEPTISHREENLSCGDDLTLDLLIIDGVITDLAWQGQGCAISQAAMSILSEDLVGMTALEAAALTPEDMMQRLGVPVGPRRTKCALLGLHTLKNALRLADGSEQQSWLETVKIDK